MDPHWLRWAKELHAIAQAGLTYSSSNPFDVDRYSRLREIAAEIAATGGGVAPGPVLELYQREKGYATPKVDVRGIVFREGRVLLVREAEDGGWTPPGGWADVNDTPSDAVIREIREESGFETRAVKLAAVYDRTRHGHQPPFLFHVYKLFMICELTGGAATTSHETSGVGFFAPDDLPPLSSSRVTAAQLARMFEHHARPDLPTDFD